MSWKKTLARFLLRYQRGESLMAIPIEVLKVTVYFGALQFIIKNWLGFDIGRNWVLLLIGVYVLLAYVSGYIDERYGIWKLQNDISVTTLTPFFEKVDKKVDSIDKVIQRLAQLYPLFQIKETKVCEECSKSVNRGEYSIIHHKDGSHSLGNPDKPCECKICIKR